MRPTTPTGSRVTSTSMPGRTEGSLSPVRRSTSPAKNLKMCPARAASPTPSGSVLPSSRDRRRPSSSLRARISVPTRSRRFDRSWIDPAAHAGAAAFAAAIAARVCAASACAYSPITSPTFDGLRLGLGGRAGDPFAGDEIAMDVGHCGAPFEVTRQRRTRQRSPRCARFRMRAPAPKVHGRILSEWLTRLTSAPSFGVAMVTMSPTACVKPCPARTGLWSARTSCPGTGRARPDTGGSDRWRA